jgi:hypothetical protein
VDEKDASKAPAAPARYVDPVVEALRKNVDKTLIRKNLALTPEERLKQLMELQRFAEELRRAGREARRR